MVIIYALSCAMKINFYFAIIEKVIIDPDNPESGVSTTISYKE